MNGGARSRKEFESVAVSNTKAFSLACTDLLAYIRCTHNWSYLSPAPTAVTDNDFMHSIGRIIYELMVPEDKKTAVRKTSMTIYDKVSKSAELNGVIQINMHTAIVYTACQALKLDTDPTLVTCMKANTLLKVVNKIRFALKK